MFKRVLLTGYWLHEVQAGAVLLHMLLLLLTQSESNKNGLLSLVSIQTFDECSKHARMGAGRWYRVQLREHAASDVA